MPDDFEEDIPQGLADYRALAFPRSARRARPLPLRGLRAQGRRRRHGRDRGMMILLMGDREDDPLFLQLKEAEHVGAGAVCGRERVRAAGRACRAGPAADAGRKRRLPRLGQRDRSSASATSTSASCGTSRDRLRSRRWRRAPGGLRRALRWDAGACARPLRRRGEIAGYLGETTRSTAHSAFADAYADQNDVTTPRSPTPRRRTASRSNAASKPAASSAEKNSSAVRVLVCCSPERSIRAG